MTVRLASPMLHMPIAAALLLFMAAPAEAEAAAASASDAAQPAPIILAPGDSVKIVVFDRPELSGTFPVGPDGMIRVPLAGALMVEGSDMTAVGALLNRRISALLDYDAPVTVDMAQYRPVFITGTVSSPGEHDYTPGLRVLQAVARAGGLALPMPPPNVTATDVTRAHHKVQAARLKVERYTTHLAALDDLLAHPEAAPTDGGQERTTTQRPLEDATSPRLRQIEQDQQALIGTRREFLDNLRLFTERRQAQLDEEVKALKLEEQALTTQTDLVRQQIRTAKSLRQKGLATNSNVLSQLQIDTSLTADMYRLLAYQSRVQEEKVKLEERFQTATNGWQADLLRERVEVAANLATAELELDAAQTEALTLRLAQLDASGTLESTQEAAFLISRAGPDGMTSFQAGPAELLRPGDILHVSLAPSSQAVRPVSADFATTDGAGDSATSSKPATPQEAYAEAPK